MSAEGLDAVEQHRDDLEELAEEDNPAAWVAEQLLEAIENAGGERP